jgi:hypothetical protein
MKRKIVVIVIVISAIVGLLIISSNWQEESQQPIFHVTLADPTLYRGGVYSDSFFIPSGRFMLHFVPNGDSPQNLEIIINGSTFYFEENFLLKGTPHNTGISEYFTWEYEGESEFVNPQNQTVKITINPHGNFLGPVSVDIIEILEN